MKTNSNLPKLFVLVITLPKGKKEVIIDLLERFDATCFFSTLAYGVYDKELSKEIMFCPIREEKVKDAIFALEDKFLTFHSKVSMVYALPMESMIGLSTYMVLANGGK